MKRCIFVETNALTMQQSFDKKSFAKAIRTKRIIDLKIGLREAGTQIGIAHATLSRMENELFNPDINNIFAVCDWLNVSVCVFIKINKKGSQVGDYGKHPTFIKQANAAKELLKKTGLPKQFYKPKK